MIPSEKHDVTSPKPSCRTWRTSSTFLPRAFLLPAFWIGCAPRFALSGCLRTCRCGNWFCMYGKQPNTNLSEACPLASGTGGLKCKLLQISLITITFCDKIVQSKRKVCLAGRPARCNLVNSVLSMSGWCEHLIQDTNTNKFSYANNQCA